MCTDTTIYEPYWVDPISEQLADILDDRNMSIEQLAHVTSLELDILKSFLSGATIDLSDFYYQKIEQALGLPENYFLKMKAKYAERAAKLAQTA